MEEEQVNSDEKFEERRRFGEIATGRRESGCVYASLTADGQWFPARRQPGGTVQMKLRRRCMQTLGVSVKQLRRKLLELGARILHVQGSKPRDMALVVCSLNLFHSYSTTFYFFRYCHEYATVRETVYFQVYWQYCLRIMECDLNSITVTVL